MHNCVAPLLADTSMRVSTPGRQCSGGMSLGSTTIIEFVLLLDTPSDFERVPLLDIEGELLHGAVAALANPGATMALHCDVSDSGAVTASMAKLSTSFGRLDALVNNAGIAVFAPLMETSDDDWSRVLEVNLTGPFLCTKAAVPLMREQGGVIVNITSISAVRASTLRSAYGTSQAGLAHLTKQLAVELASLGIRVNGV